MVQYLQYLSTCAYIPDEDSIFFGRSQIASQAEQGWSTPRTRKIVQALLPGRLQIFGSQPNKECFLAAPRHSLPGDGSLAELLCANISMYLVGSTLLCV